MHIYEELYIVRLDILQFVQEKGGDPTAKDSEGRDAHDIALFYKHDHIASLFGAESPAKRFSV